MFTSLRRIAAALERLVQLAEAQTIAAGFKLPPRPQSPSPPPARPARVYDHDDELTWERERVRAKEKAAVTGGFGAPPGR